MNRRFSVALLDVAPLEAGVDFVRCHVDGETVLVVYGHDAPSQRAALARRLRERGADASVVFVVDAQPGSLRADTSYVTGSRMRALAATAVADARVAAAASSAREIVTEMLTVRFECAPGGSLGDPWTASLVARSGPALGLRTPFALDGRARGVSVDVVKDGGFTWVDALSRVSFGAESSSWTGRRSGKKRGLRDRLERMLRAAEQNPVDGEAPRVVASFARGVARDVAEAIAAMGAHVEGNVLDMTVARAPVYPSLALLANARLALGAEQGFAMWTRGAGRASFERSPERASIARAFEALAGIEPHAYTALLRDLRAIGPRAPLVALPEALTVWPIQLASGCRVALSVSAEKGIRWHVPPNEGLTRRELWAELAAHAVRLRRLVLGPVRSVVGRRDSGPLQWWRACDAVAVREDASEVGVLVA